jgi:hypothetical protein
MAAKRSRKSVTSSKKPCCPGPPSRRDFLKVGFIGGLGLSLGDYFLMTEAMAEGKAKAESVIYVFLAGGLSHIDSFDPKPYAPIEYRGELGQVGTNTGDQFGGLCKNLAQVADRLAVIRSMTHGEAAHERGTHNMLTGYRPSPAIAYPSFGSVVAHEYGPRQDLPAYICIPNAGDPYLGTGYLSPAHGPFSVGGEPANKGFEVRDLNMPGGVDAARMEGRKSLLETVDHHFSTLEASDLLGAMDSYYQRAYDLISSQSAREAFNVAAEEDAMKDRYGRTPMGQRLLLSRRLVEAGARFVTVLDGGYDNHKDIKKALSGRLPAVDQGLAALVTDLEERALLDKTLIVVASEFGRTAKLNPDAGRDHWPKAFSVVMAGGGIKGGTIHGSTDPRGQEPADNPVGPEDLATTIFTLLGVDPEKRLMSPGNRPIDIVRGGKLIESVLA